MEQTATHRILAHAFAEECLRSDNIWILTHNHPDGDTAGTGEALLNVLSALGKNAVVACNDPLPHALKFMEQYAPSSRCFFGNPEDIPFQPDTVISVDVASPGLVSGFLFPYTKRIDLALDHHEINTLTCGKLFVEPFSSSSGETLYSVIRELETLSEKHLFTPDVACALYTAIVSDSGNFKYSCTGSRTLRTAAELMEQGADSAYIARMLFDTKALSVFRAEALCTENVSFYCGGRLAFSYMTLDMCRERNLSETDFDTCVQLLRMIEGVEVSIFAKEKTPLEDGTQRFRLSMRSNEFADVAAVCAQFDGGGHKRAAGCTVNGTPTAIAVQMETVFSPVLAPN